jgi:hypothetical protein
MDGEIYKQNFKDQFFPNLHPNSLRVLDGASYHSHKIKNISTLSWKNDKIQEWIILHAETSEEYKFKKHLMETVSSIRPSYGKYNIVEIENEMGWVV